MRSLLLATLMGVSIGVLTGCSDKKDTFEGRVIDYYLEKATVISGNQVVQTDKYGKFVLSGNEPIVAKGGLDIALKRLGEEKAAFKGVLKAPPRSKVVTAFTTMTQKLVEQGYSINDAKVKVKEKFDLKDIELTTYDPIATLLKEPNNTIAKEIFKKQAQVQALLNSTAVFVSEKVDVNTTQAFEKAVEIVLNEVENEEDINNTEVVENIIVKTAQEVVQDNEALTTITEEASAVAEKITEVVSVIDTATEEVEDVVEVVKTTEAAIAVAQEVVVTPNDTDIRKTLEEIKDTIKEKDILLPVKPKEVLTGAEG